MKQQLQFLLVIFVTAFVLTSCYEDELYPAANFSTTGFVPGFKWRLDATSSVSISGQKLMYRWDYDEDQTQYDTPWLTEPVFFAMGNSSNYLKIVTLQIKDENGLTTEVSKEVYGSSFLSHFRHDTIRTGQIKIPYNTYRWILQSRYQGGDWMRQNVFLSSSEIATNLADSLLNGSYVNWQGATTFKSANPNFILPTKENWDGLINLFFGDELAGFNLQVDNQYGLGLGLNGYVNNNQLVESNEKSYYWTATEVDSDHAWALEVVKNSDSVRFVSLPKAYQCKVRLVFPIEF